MIVDPCVPADWKQFQVTRKWRGATFRIAVSNPEGVEKGVRSVTLDGEIVKGAIAPQKAGSDHRVDVVMG
jgi:N,N'-diacetylchitobiose phosphorylase